MGVTGQPPGLTGLRRLTKTCAHANVIATSRCRCAQRGSRSRLLSQRWLAGHPVETMISFAPPTPASGITVTVHCLACSLGCRCGLTVWLDLHCRAADFGICAADGQRSTSGPGKSDSREIGKTRQAGIEMVHCHRIPVIPADSVGQYQFRSSTPATQRSRFSKVGLTAFRFQVRIATVLLGVWSAGNACTSSKHTRCCNSRTATPRRPGCRHESCEQNSNQDHRHN